jgi:carbonic anhydrase
MQGFSGLLEGYRRFRDVEVAPERQRWRELAEGQSPEAVIIACCDSRADPATIFDTDPGQIFVVRNVANLVPPYEPGGGRHGVSAALEFAVTVLDIPQIVVMGHERCGGIQASLSGQFANSAPGEGGFIAQWMDLLEEPRALIASEHGEGPDAAHLLEEAGIRQSLANLRTFPFVAEREAAGKLSLHGCHFSIFKGQLFLFDEAEGSFHPV